MKKIITLTTLALLFSAPFAQAEEFMSADEVKALFTNKSFDVRNEVKGKDLQGYDDDQGNHLIYIPWKNKVSQRKWWMEGNKHCTSHPKRGDYCKDIKDMGNGVYHGMQDGKHTHTMTNFRDGKQFNK